MTEQQQLAIINELRQAASHSAYNRYSAMGQVGGVAIAITGSAVLSVLVPVATVGTVAGVTTGVLIYGLSIAHTRSEMERCINGGVDEIKAYLSPENIQAIVAQYAPEKKPLTQETPTKSGTTTPSNGSPSPEPCRSLPIQPVALAPESHLIAWGRTRGGKTNTVQHLLKDAQNVHYVSTKAKDQVPTHWHGYRLDPRQAEQQLTWLMDTWEAIFYSHLDGATQGHTWFLFDEIISLMALAPGGLVKRIRDFITQVLTSGAGVGAYVGLLTQSENAGELKIALDLLKNCTMVACSVKACDRNSMIQAYAKYTGIGLTPSDRKYIQSLTGYWQLWDNEGPCLSQIGKVECSTKPLELCPASDALDKPQSIKDRVISYLKRTPQPQKVRDIRSNIKRSDDDSSTLTTEVKDALSYLVGEGFVMEEPSGQTTVYWWINSD